MITASTPSYVDTRSYKLATARLLTDSDSSTEARVTVLGSQAATDLFGPLNPIGRSVSAC